MAGGALLLALILCCLAADPALAQDDGTGTSPTVLLPLIQRNVEALHAPWPATGAQGVSVNTNLLWEPSTRKDVHFSVYLAAGDASPDAELGRDLAVAGFDPPELAPNTTYYWQVGADWSDGASTLGPVWSFTTDGPTSTPDLDAMVSVPGGFFWMGCDRAVPQFPCSWNEYHYDEPVRQVWVSSFALDKFEVTNREYRKCVDARACDKPRVTLRYDDPEHVIDPVIYVSWYDAQEYCRWEGKRLPTEAEWEKAARGTLDTRIYPWGNAEPDCTQANNWNFERNCSSAPHGPRPGGSRWRGASPYGAQDMAGNVFEWVQDRYDVWYYVYSPTVDPQGPAFSRTLRTNGSSTEPVTEDEHGFPLFTIRGGSWMDRVHYMRVTHRHWGHYGEFAGDDAPYFRSQRVGFRCARSIP